MVNKVVLTMVYSDFLFIAAGGFLAPIIAIYFTEQIQGATIATVGFATMTFWGVKSAVQIPVSRTADAIFGERDDFTFLIIGSVIRSIVPLLYYFFASEVWHIFVFETINAIGHAFVVPTWYAIFTRHIDRFKESSEWTLHSNMIGLGFAGAAAVGGVLAERFGFRSVFLLVSAFMFFGTIVLLFMKNEMSDHDGRTFIREK